MKGVIGVVSTRIQSLDYIRQFLSLAVRTWWGKNYQKRRDFCSPFRYIGQLILNCLKNFKCFYNSWEPEVSVTLAKSCVA